MNIRLDGKRALVCGSSQGIGRAVAEEMARSGAEVILTSRNAELLKSVCSSLPNDKNQKHGCVAADFSSPGQAHETIMNYLSQRGPVHILVNNSGGPAPGMISEADIADIRAAFDRHLVMSQLLTKSLLPGMKAEDYGRILNIISISVKQPIENLGISNTVRWAMASWAKTLSREVGGYGITVNNLLPGYTATERLDSLMENRARNADTSVEEIKKGIVENVPAGRIAEPRELAFAAVFLASEYASYINGINLPVDGGFLRNL